MSIVTENDIVAGLASPQKLWIIKTLTAPKAAGAFQSAWMAAGNPGAGSASPAYTAGSGYTCDRTTAGAITITNGAVQNWIARLMLAASQPGVILLMDRLWSCSGMGYAAATYTVTTPGNLPARITDNGVGVQAWVEQFVAAGAASGTLTLNYLNANTGASKSAAIAAVVSAPVAGQLQPIPLAAGDTGVRQVTSAVNSATWTSGSFGITLAKRILEIPVRAAADGQLIDWAGVLNSLPSDVCLMLAFLAYGTTAPVLLGNIDVIDK